MDKTTETTTSDGKVKQKLRNSLGKRIRRNIPFYMIILPTLLLVFFMRYLPMMGILIAFKDYNAKLGIFGSPWADMSGFGNFVEIFRTPALAESIWNTLYVNVLSLVISFPAPIILALLLTEVKTKGYKKTVQTISYLPHFLSIAAVTTIVNMLLDKYGLVNAALNGMGMDSIDLLEKEKAFIPVYLFTVLWQTVGWNSIVYLSAIAGVSSDLYEAADLDGANRFQKVIHVTLPSILPTAIILLIMNMGSLFGSNFELVYGLQNPVGWKMEVISTAVWKFGVQGAQYGLGTALSLMQGLVAIILTFSANAVAKKVSNVSMW